MTDTNQAIRQHAEQEYAHELTSLQEVETAARPPNWELSPWAFNGWQARQRRRH